MPIRRALPIACLAAAVCASAPAMAQVSQVTVCPSLALAQQVQPTLGAPLPSGCRMVGVRRVDTPTGPVCAVDFSEDGQGLFADILDATVQTRWWTACANLNPP
jgi:hypothetical protein